MNLLCNQWNQAIPSLRNQSVYSKWNGFSERGNVFRNSQICVNTITGLAGMLLTSAPLTGY